LHNVIAISIILICSSQNFFFGQQTNHSLEMPRNQATAPPQQEEEEVIDLTGADDEEPPQASPPGPIRRSRRLAVKRPTPYSRTKRGKAMSDPKPEPEHDSSMVTLTCSICMDSILNRNPVSTVCGHLFCKECLELSLKCTKKTCPLCRTKLTGKAPFHSIHL